MIAFKIESMKGGKLKLLKAVAPYTHSGFLNFKAAPFVAWKQVGGAVAKAHYPCRLFHGAAYRWELPTVWKSTKEARLRFVEPVSLSFDTFPDYARYEVVPMIWDCWPRYFEKTCAWLKRHKVRTAVFTSRQTAGRMRARFPDMNIIWCPEAVDGSVYSEGKRLAERGIDLLEFGRSNAQVFDAERLHRLAGTGDGLRHVCTRQGGKFVYTNEQLRGAMADARVTIALPRSMTQPEMAGDVETLTQRYWECMFSRIVMVGHAPQELVDFVGYNPVVELREDVPASELIVQVLERIEDYQPLVDCNFATAQRLGSWDVRMAWLMGMLRADYRFEA